MAKVRLLFSKNVIEINCDRNDTETMNSTRKILQDNIYPIHSNRIGNIHKVSVRHTPEILTLFRGEQAIQNIHNAPKSVQKLYHDEIARRACVPDLLRGGHKEDCKVNDYLTLDPHQQLGRELSRYFNRFAYFYDTRTGKTPMSLTIIHDDLKENPTHKWLIICPLILIEEAWLEDCKKFFPNTTIINCHDTTPIKRINKINSQGEIYVTNTKSFVAYKEHFEKIKFEGCFVDESSSLKSHKSKISKAMVDYAFNLNRFYLLSGTPAPNGEEEYYMQIRAIDPYGMPRSYSQCMARYFTNVSYNPQYPKWMLRPDKHDEFFDLIKMYATYVDKEDVLETPGRTFHTVEFDLTDDVKKQYRQLKNELYVELKDSLIITAPSAAAKLNKLNQVTSGFIIDTQAVQRNKFYEDSNDQECYLLSDKRYQILLDLLNGPEMSNEQVLIWANYHKEFEVISGLLGDKCGCVYGGTKLAEKSKNLKAFKSGEIPYLIANPASADKGLTLTNAHFSIYFSLNWSYELFKQSMERIYGDIKRQPHHCHYYVIIAKGTIDGILYNDVLQKKQAASYAVLDHLKGDIFNATS